MPNDVKCPKCGSTQIHAEKRGFTLTTGLIGSRSIYLTCLACGKQFKPGQGGIGFMGMLMIGAVVLLVLSRAC